MNILISWLIYAVSIIIAAYILPGVNVDNFLTALILAIVLGIINAFLRPIFILLTLPVTVLSLGLFVFVINALLVMLAAYIVPGFMVSGFWAALFFAIILAIIHWALNSLRKETVAA